VLQDSDGEDKRNDGSTEDESEDDKNDPNYSPNGSPRHRRDDSDGSGGGGGALAAGRAEVGAVPGPGLAAVDPPQSSSALPRGRVAAESETPASARNRPRLRRPLLSAGQTAAVGWTWLPLWAPLG
jgi:hypothetical protein